MNTKDFYIFYNLEDEDVLLIKNTPDGLLVRIDAHVRMHYMGNGIRGDFDDYYVNDFVFKDVFIDEDIASPIVISSYKYDNELIFMANNKEIRIKDTDVILVKKYWNDKYAL
jgi:hypothetical protein